MLFRLLPAGRRSELVREDRRSYRPFREQVRSYGLRPESKADLCITPSLERGNDHQRFNFRSPTRCPNPLFCYWPALTSAR
ncbi:hypothetical protein GIW06_02135 [Pseudomonas syringae]|nr:hypothetical protein [Pseudomonas syringae]MCF5292981.1 hypothetical protein [Pseudomonas syringae]MCF5296994.1 hypothetical protein [Pseudomonas syringae]MCF5350143.1 hypothetical protein [Pseudomonas syringae]MCF5382638.1 hypothetical protein [Pseudomonas syringae]